MRVMLSIPSLALGGAERQFAELARGLAGRGHDVLAVTLGQGGPLAAALGGVPLVELGKRSRLDNLRVTLALGRLLGEFKPDTHYAFLTAANVLGALLTFSHGHIPLVMGVRATPVRHEAYSHGLAGRTIETLERLFARRAALVIANSGPGREACLERGMAPEKLHVVPNGIDTARCRPERALGLPLREQWGIAPDAPLIGLVARLDPMKDHENFFKAALIVSQHRPEARLVCVGGGPQGYMDRLRRASESLGLADQLTGRLIWSGPLADMPGVYNALDLLCLSSAYGEGFPNVLGEAMACGTPCVTTDVGDAALVVGDTGPVVPRRDPGALAGAMLAQLERLEREGDELRRACRARVEANFSVERMVESSEALLLGLAEGRR